MSVVAQIAQYMFRAAERPFGVDDPVVAEQHSQPGCVGSRSGKRQQAAVELEFPSMEGHAKSGDELAAEDAAGVTLKHRMAGRPLELEVLLSIA